MSSSVPANPPFDVEAVARHAQEHGLVILAGAGVSVGPPASLPNWNAINDAFIVMLSMEVAEHTDFAVAFDFPEFIASRRDDAGVAPPDLQAQFAEESLGNAYFKLFEPLDIDAWNESHASIAALARSGVLRAVITTNFDRLIELAFETEGVEHSVFCSPGDFTRLAKVMPETSIPIIKVHGSVDRLDTIVDTLRQRVLGRPAALESVLDELFSRHAVLVLGFSGADLAYDRHYLRLQAGAQAAPAFTFLNQAGRKPREEIVELVRSAPRARIVDGELPEELTKLVASMDPQRRRKLVSPKWDPEMDYPGIRKASLAAKVSSTVQGSITPVQATVVLASILEAAGSPDAAFHVLTRTMPHHTKAGLLTDAAMPRQQRMIAAELIEMARVYPDLSPDAGLTALSVLTHEGVREDTVGLALKALAFALGGDAVSSDAASLAAIRESREDFHPARRADTICVLARAWTIFERWVKPHRVALALEYESMFHYGDEPRRIRVGALYGRFLIETGEIEEAERVLVTCLHASRLLKLPLLHCDLSALAGRLCLAQGRADEALQRLCSVYRHYEQAGQLLRCAETLMPLREAAVAAGDQELLANATSDLLPLLEPMPGLALAHAASQVRVCLAAGEFDLARDAVKELRALGDRWADNIWIGELANRLEQQIVRGGNAAAS